MEKDIEQFEGQLIQWHKLMLEGESPWVAYQPPQVTSEPPQTTDQPQEVAVSECSVVDGEKSSSSKFASLSFADKQRFFDEIAIIFLENDLDNDGYLTKDEFESIQVSYLNNAKQDDKDELFKMYLR